MELVLESIVTLLLGATIYYCWRLNRLLTTIRDSKGELAQLLGEFSATTMNAQATLAELREGADRLTSQLQARVEKADRVADDLMFLLEKAGKTAQQWDVSMKAAQQAARTSPAKPQVPAQPAPQRQAPPPHRPQAPKPQQSAPQAPPPPVKRPQPATESVDDMLAGLAKKRSNITEGKSAIEKIARKEPVRPAAPARQASWEEVHESEGALAAERELLDALKAIRQ